MQRVEFMKVKYKHLPEDIMSRYNLGDKVTEMDTNTYIRIEKSMYGLKNAVILAYGNLKKKLEPHGYTPIVGTTGMWGHKTRQTKFCVCVDDFGIKYPTHMKTRCTY